MMPSFPNRMASVDANIASAGPLQVARRPSKRRQTGETLPSPVFFFARAATPPQLASRFPYL